MNEFPIPIRVIGPGSQPAEDEELQYMPMPRGMNTFRMPSVPDGADAAAVAAMRAVLSELLAAMGTTTGAPMNALPIGATGEPTGTAMGEATGNGAPVAGRRDLAGIAPEALNLLNQMLGEGEVMVQIGGTPSYRIQESVFPGIWRVLRFGADGQLSGDWVEAGGLPQVALEAAHRTGAATLRLPDAIPVGAMNAPALLHEIAAQSRSRQAGDDAHVVNLTLLPLSPADHALLEEVLPVGPVAIIARGFGNCRITSTQVRDVWRVQYFNHMNTLILNTIEVVDLPPVAQAAREDLDDSRDRLAELIDWIDEAYADNATR